jgi:hypothetical protein
VKGLGSGRGEERSAGSRAGGRGSRSDPRLRAGSSRGNSRQSGTGHSYVWRNRGRGGGGAEAIG